MASYIATGPDGQKYKITAPDNATTADLTAYAQKNFSALPKKEPAQPTTNKPSFVDRMLEPRAQSNRPFINPTVSEQAGVGWKELGTGARQLALQAGLPTGDKPEDLAKQSADLESKERGGIIGWIARQGGQFPLYMVGGPESKMAKAVGEAVLPNAGRLAKVMAQGGWGGVKAGTMSGALAPSSDPNQTLKERGVDTAISGAAGGVLGAAGVGATAGMGKALSRKVPGAITGEQAKDITAMTKHGAGSIPKDPGMAQEKMLGAAESAKNRSIQAATGASNPATSAYQLTRRATDAVGRGVAKLNGVAANLYRRAEIPAERVVYNDKEGSRAIVGAAMAAQKDGVKLGPELTKMVDELTGVDKQALGNAKLADKAKTLSDKIEAHKTIPDLHKREEEINGLRKEVHDLLKASTEPDDTLGQKRLELINKRIEQASAKLSRAKTALEKLKEGAERKAGIIGLEAKTAMAGATQKKALTVRDLIKMDKRLNGLKYGASEAERGHYEAIQSEIQKQIVEHAPDVAGDYMRAKGNYRVLTKMLKGETAKSLGIGKAFMEAVHGSMSDDPKLAEASYRNALTSIKGIEGKITSKEQLSLLRELLPQEQYGKIIGDLINSKTRTFDPQAIKDFEPLFKNIVSLSGIKGEQPNVAYAELKRIATLMSQTTGAKRLPPEQIRNGKMIFTRLVNGLKFALAGAHGNVGSAFAISHGAEALEGGLPALEGRVKGLRNYMQPAQKPLLALPGASRIGGAIGTAGDATGRDLQK